MSSTNPNNALSPTKTAERNNEEDHNSNESFSAEEATTPSDSPGDAKVVGSRSSFPAEDVELNLNLRGRDPTPTKPAAQEPWDKNDFEKFRSTTPLGNNKRGADPPTWKSPETGNDPSSPRQGGEMIIVSVIKVACVLKS